MSDSSITCRWVVAHEPLDLFLRSANIFKNIIEKESNGRIKIEVYTKSEFDNENNLDQNQGLYRALEDNKFEMAQFQTTAVGTHYKNFFVFDMPFLFKNHDHATRVLDGAIGENLLELLSKNTSMRGLAFTYSGGFRVMVSNQPLTGLDDIKGKTVSCAESPITEKIYDILGANTILDDSGDDLSAHFARMKDINFDGGETTLVRFDKVKDKTPYITNTQHSLFLTTIVVSNEFWDTLSDSDKKIFKDTAKKTALIERTETINDSARFVEESKERCKGFFEFNADEMVKFKNLTSQIYKSDLVKNIFTPALLKKIVAA
jgi:TRAP-type C4-dicarboxylate transport system substrate-binding protein